MFVVLGGEKKKENLETPALDGLPLPFMLMEGINSDRRETYPCAMQAPTHNSTRLVLLLFERYANKDYVRQVVQDALFNTDYSVRK